MKNCLIATDGSDHANDALEIASSLTLGDEWNLIVVHIIDHNEVSTNIMDGIQVEFGDELEKRLSAISRSDQNLKQTLNASHLLSQHREVSRVVNAIYAEQILKRAEHDLTAKGHNSVATLILEGDPSELIVQQALEREVEMVVLGCRGLGHVKRAFGSVSQQVAHELDCRVVMVK